MKSWQSKFIYGILCASLLSSLAGIQPAYAAPTNWYVTTTGNDANSCTTIASPCLTINGAIGKAVTGDTINVAAGTYTSSGAEVVLINKNITLSGGWDITFTTQNGTSIIDVQGSRRGITVNTNIVATLDSLTVQNGFHANQGGGIRNSGTLTINNSIIKNNVSYVMGGGIFTFGTLTVNNTIISGNSAGATGNSGGGGGGGIENYSGTTTLNNTTLSGNTLLGFFSGSAISNNTTLILNNSTVSNNTYSPSINFTGSITSFSLSGVTINNSTISSNTGVGVYIIMGALSLNNSTISNNLYYGIAKNSSYPGTVNIENSIVANNTINDCSGPISSAGHNLIGNISNCTFSAATGDLVGTNLAPVDPKLGPLQDNGGPTFTHALPLDSPAINTGNNATCLATDQRGVSRPQGTLCDIGAYEYSDTIPPTVVANSLVASYSITGPSNFTVMFSEDVNDPSGNTVTDDVTNPTNYLLINKGINGTADTASCKGGLVADDTQVAINSITYNSATFTSTVNINGGAALPAGSYHLFVCGTTSIVDLVLNPLNGGTDYTFDFVVNAAPTPVPTTNNSNNATSSLPDTGFTPNRITSLAPQPANHAYSNLGDIWLEIPALKVKTNIVGVPKANNTWDVSWLGKDTGWLNGTAFPSWDGNSVLTAHVTDSNGMPGPFANIKNLKYGNQVIVHLYGQKYIFEVRNTRRVRPNATQFAFQHLEDHSYLTLITCQGYNPISDSYLFRRIIRAVLVDVQSE